MVKSDFRVFPMNFGVFLFCFHGASCLFDGFCSLLKGISPATWRFHHANGQLPHLKTSDSPETAAHPEAVGFHHRISRSTQNGFKMLERLDLGGDLDHGLSSEADARHAEIGHRRHFRALGLELWSFLRFLKHQAIWRPMLG